MHTRKNEHQGKSANGHLGTDGHWGRWTWTLLGPEGLGSEGVWGLGLEGLGTRGVGRLIGVLGSGGVGDGRES